MDRWVDGSMDGLMKTKTKQNDLVNNKYLQGGSRPAVGFPHFLRSEASRERQNISTHCRTEIAESPQTHRILPGPRRRGRPRPCHLVAIVTW